MTLARHPPSSISYSRSGLSLLRGFVAFFPGALGRLGDEAFFEGARRDADVTDFAAGQQRLHPLQIHMEFALGDRGDVRADTAALLRFTTAPDDTAFHRAFAGQFTDSCHKISFVKGRTDYLACAMMQALFPQFTGGAGSVILEAK